MIDLRKAPVVRILVPFASGAVAGYRWTSHYQVCEVVLLIMLIGLLVWISLLVVFLKLRSRPAWINLVFVLLAFMLFLAAGFGNGLFTSPRNPGLPVREHLMIQGEISENPHPGKHDWVLDMKLNSVVSEDSSFSTRSRIKVYFKMPPDSILPSAGETWRLHGTLLTIKNSGNPGEPDYEAIMQRKGYWYRFFTDNQFPAMVLVKDLSDRRIQASNLRRTMADRWEGDPEVTALLKAVCLGDRTSLTNDLQQAFSAAGGMHLLAVSGLHVGLIWWVLQHALAWMVRLFRKEYYRAITIILLLWFYAFITGFSSSVSRSVTMFTLFTISRMIEQRTHPVNGILVSAFILIFINPGRLLEVGFQLSYAAIIGIVNFYPILRGLLKVNNKILKWIWEVTLVSLSAQLATIPLVIYYFHQLPAYSLLTNLLSIPLLSGLIAIFVISVPFMSAGLLFDIFNGLLYQLGNLMNQSMELIASIPGAVIGDLNMHRVSLTILMLFIFLGMGILSHRSTVPRYAMLLMLTVILGWTSWCRLQRIHSTQLIVAHFSGGSLVTFRSGLQVEHFRWCTDSVDREYMDQYTALNWDRRRYKTITFDVSDSIQIRGSICGCRQVTPGLWIMGNDRIQGWVISGIFGSEYHDFLRNQQVDFILWSGEPGVRDLFYRERAEQIDFIVDGSNRAWYIRQMKQNMGSIHYTSEQGAYLKRW